MAAVTAATTTDPPPVAGGSATKERPINRPMHHRPVLARAVSRLAAVRPGDVWVDCTLGFAGHAGGLLDEGARLYGVDQDPDALRHANQTLTPFGDRVNLLHGNFRDLERLLADVGPVDGVLADLGVSSYQLDRPERGFSFQAAGPVDMRMDPTRGEPALALIGRLTVPELADVIRRYGEEPFAGPVARSLAAWVAGSGPFDTETLARAVVAGLPKKAAAKRRRHPATRTFQALRMAVNDELGALASLLDALPRVLAPGGRALIISFHSLEDRMVKRRFAELCGLDRQAPRRGLPPPPAPPAGFELLTRKPATADEGELAENPRARSARLRAVRRLDTQGAA